jgi:hypothetical protein
MLLSSNNPVFFVKIVFLVRNDLLNVFVNLFHAVPVRVANERLAFHAIGDQNEVSVVPLAQEFVSVFHV